MPNQPPILVSRRSALLVISVVLSFQQLIAQNLESIGKEKPLTITGGLSLNQIVYAADGINSRRDPYSYFASGNINVNLSLVELNRKTKQESGSTDFTLGYSYSF